MKKITPSTVLLALIATALIGSLWIAISGLSQTLARALEHALSVSCMFLPIVGALIAKPYDSPLPMTAKEALQHLSDGTEPTINTRGVPIYAKRRPRFGDLQDLEALETIALWDLCIARAQGLRKGGRIPSGHIAFLLCCGSAPLKALLDGNARGLKLRLESDALAEEDRERKLLSKLHPDLISRGEA